MPPAPPVTTTTWPVAFTARALASLGPALREGQCAGAEGSSLPLPRPGTARRLGAVSRQPRAQSRDQDRAHAVRTVGRRVGLLVDQQGIADLIPGERDLLALSRHALGPEIA